MESLYAVCTTLSIPHSTPHYDTYAPHQQILLELGKLPQSLKFQRIEEMGFNFGFLSQVLNYWKVYRIPGTERCPADLLTGTTTTTTTHHLQTSASGSACQRCGYQSLSLHDLLLHHSSAHLSAQILERFGELSKRAGRSSYKATCKLCQLVFEQTEKLVDHVALVHSVVQLSVQSPFTILSCGLCSSSFEYKVSLMEHYQKAHAQTKTLTEINAVQREGLIQCSRCPFKGSLQNLKFHCVDQHCYPELDQLMSFDMQVNNRCAYCPHRMTGDRRRDVFHYAVGHNFVLRYVVVGQDVVFEASLALEQENNIFVVERSAAVTAAVGNPDEQVLSDLADPLDPLGHHTGLQEPSSGFRVKAEFGEVSERSQETENVVIMLEGEGSHHDPAGSKSVKKQDTLKLCPFCQKKVLSSKFVSHVSLSHLSLDIKREITRQQSLKSMPTFRCPDCPAIFKGKPLNHLVVHFAAKHSKVFLEKVGETRVDTVLAAGAVARMTAADDGSDNEENVDDPGSCGPESDGETGAARPGRTTAAPSASASSSPVWVKKFTAFCEENASRYPEAKQFINSNFTVLGPSILDLFLNQLTHTVANIHLLTTVVAQLETVSSITLAALPTVRRHLLLVDYAKKCEQEKTTVQQVNPMHIVIFLSQVLGRPDVEKADLHWLLTRISRLHDRVDGQPVGLCKKITDFFEVIQSPVDSRQLDPQFDRNAKKCRKCERSFGNYKELNAHLAESAACAPPAAALKSVKALRTYHKPESSDSSDLEIYIPKNTGTRRTASASSAGAYRCSMCSFTFKTEELRDTHMDQVHPSFTCDLCNKEFTSRIGLKIHERQAHTESSPASKGHHRTAEAARLRAQLKAGMDKMGFSFETTSKIFQLSSPGQGEFSPEKIKRYLEGRGDEELGSHVGRWLDHVERYRAEYENPEVGGGESLDAAAVEQLRRRVRAIKDSLGYNSAQMMQRINAEVGGGAPIKEWEYVYFEAGLHVPKKNEMRVIPAIRQFCELFPPSKDKGTTTKEEEERANWAAQAERLRARRKAQNLTHDDVAREINSRLGPAKPINGKLIWNLEKMKDGSYREQVLPFVIRWLDEAEEEKEGAASPRQEESCEEEVITKADLAEVAQELRNARSRLGISQAQAVARINKELALDVELSRSSISQVT
jgi:hypothetical protein